MTCLVYVITLMMYVTCSNETLGLKIILCRGFVQSYLLGNHISDHNSRFVSCDSFVPAKNFSVVCAYIA